MIVTDQFSVLQDQQLLILLTDWNNNTLEVTADNFKIASEEDKFKLSFGSVSPSQYNSLYYHRGILSLFYISLFTYWLCFDMIVRIEDQYKYLVTTSPPKRLDVLS